MKAYLIANITVTDAEAYKAYRDGVAPVLAQYGGRFLVRAGTIHPLEGDLGIDRCMVIEFPTLAAARGFYDSAEYAPLLKLRLAAARSQVAIVEGIVPT